MKSTIHATPLDATRWVLELQGLLDARVEKALLAAHGRVTREGARWLGLDCSGLRRLDGSGLSLLVRLMTWTRRNRQRLGAFHLTPRCLQVLREQGFDAAMSLFSPETPIQGGREIATFETDRAEICPAAEWALGLGRARVAEVDGAGHRLNVEGRKIATPLQGFGELWHKVYRLSLAGAPVTEYAVAEYCKHHLGELWPEGNDLWLSGAELLPGAVGHIRLRLPGGLPLSTGVRVLHVGRNGFTLITLEGHMESGWITFSAWSEAGGAVVQVESLARTADPLYEAGFKLFGHSQQEAFWESALTRLANHYRVVPQISIQRTCLDSDRHWAGARGVVRNAALGTGIAVGAGLLRRLLGKSR